MVDRKRGAVQLLAVGVVAVAIGSEASAAELAKYVFNTNTVAAERIKSVDTDPSATATSFVGSAALGARATVASATDYVVFADSTGNSFDGTKYVGFTLSIVEP